MINPLLFLLQLTDSALPIGGYSHSWGLETAVQAGRLTSAQQVYDYLAGILQLSLAPQEGRACGLAHIYAQQEDSIALIELQQRLQGARWATEPRRASLDLGKRLSQWASRTWQLNCPNSEFGLHHCLVFGWLCGQVGIAQAETIQAYLFSTLTSLVSAAVRLVPLGHSDGQRILADLQPLLHQTPSLVEGTLTLSSFAPLLERDCQAHQTLYSRLFQS